MRRRIAFLLGSLLALLVVLSYTGKEQQREKLHQELNGSELVTEVAVEMLAEQKSTDAENTISEEPVSEADEKIEALAEAEVKTQNLPQHLLYYYESLSAEDKQLYEEIYTVMMGHLQQVDVSTTDSKKIGQLMEYVLLDNPQIFYVDSLKTQTTTIGDLVTLAISSSEIMDREKQDQAWMDIEAYKNQCLNAINPDLSDYHKALFIYEYVITHLKYVEGAKYNQSLYSAALGESVCRGYACAFKYLCDEVGLPCIMVTGSMQGQNHAWNLVQLDGVWCQVDCTAGDDLVDMGYEVDYSWFGVSDSYMSQTHSLEKQVKLPVAGSMDYCYYVQNQRYFEAYDFESLAKLLGSGEDFSFQCADAMIYDKYQYEMSNSQEIAIAIGQGKSVQFMGNGSTNTIYVLFQ